MATITTIQSNSSTYDNMLSSTNPTWNYGLATYLQLDTTKSILLKFLTSSNIPTSATITAATLSLYHYGGGNTSSLPIQGYKMLKNWSEGTKTGSTAAANQSCWTYQWYNTTMWTSPGATSAGVDIAADSSWSSSENNTINDWHQYSSSGIVSDVQSWVSGSSSNYGWLIKATSSADSKQYYSSEYIGDVSKIPKLSVTYTLPIPIVTISSYKKTSSTLTEVQIQTQQLYGVITEKGIVVGISINPTTSSSQKALFQTGSNYLWESINLSPNTHYYMRAYVITEDSGTTYSPNYEFFSDSGIDLNLSALYNNNNNLFFSWVSPTGGASKYEIYRETDLNNSIYSGTALFYTDISRISNTSYSYRIYTYNSNNEKSGSYFSITSKCPLFSESSFSAIAGPSIGTIIIPTGVTSINATINGGGAGGSDGTNSSSNGSLSSITYNGITYIAPGGLINSINGDPSSYSGWTDITGGGGLGGATGNYSWASDWYCTISDIWTEQECSDAGGDWIQDSVATTGPAGGNGGQLTTTNFPVTAGQTISFNTGTAGINSGSTTPESGSIYITFISGSTTTIIPIFTDNQLQIQGVI